MDIAKLVGNNIKYYRKKLGMTQEQLAEFSDLHMTFIGKVERGESNVTLESIQKIAEGLKLPASTLLMEQEKIIENELYDLIKKLTEKEQEIMLSIIESIKEFKNIG